MWKSVVYKEWLKIRWFAIVFAGLGILAVGNIFLRVQHDFTFNDANNYWYFILFQGFQYFGYGFFKFVPVVGGLGLAVAQYFPETVNKRIKLTFHLPIKENNVLFMMMFFGAFCLFVIDAIMFVLFTSLSLMYFPIEMISASLVSTAPWFLSGFVSYFLVALVVLEPVWKYRFLYALVAATFVPIFLESAVTGAYAPALPLLILFAIVLSISLLFSGYRFRKGEM